MFGNNIAKRVKAHYKAKIDEGQKEYDQLAEQEDQSLSDGITALTDANRRNKNGHEEDVIKKIIG